MVLDPERRAVLGAEQQLANALAIGILRHILTSLIDQPVIQIGHRLADAAHRADPGRVAGQATFGGSSVWMQAPEGVDTSELATRLREQSVLIEPGESFFAGPDQPRNFYRLAYSSIGAERIGEGVAKIAGELA